MWRARLLLLALLAGALPAPALAAQTLPEGFPGRLIEPRTLQPVPGTRVSIAPPPGFLPSTRFPGFHRPDAASSIVVAEFAAPVEPIRAAMTAQALRGQGMTLLSSSRAVAGGIVGTLYSVREQIRGKSYRKWMALFGNDREAVLLTASFPEALASELAEPLKTSLLGSGWNPRARIDQQDGLRFRLREREDLRVLQRAGNMLVLGDPARRARPAALDPMLVAGEALSDTELGDLAVFAEQRARQLDRVSGVRDVQGQAIDVDGRPAYELTATADDVYGGGPMLLYQLIVPEGRQYLLVQALVGSDEEALWLPRFREVARSVTLLE